MILACLLDTKRKTLNRLAKSHGLGVLALQVFNVICSSQETGKKSQS